MNKISNKFKTMDTNLSNQKASFIQILMMVAASVVISLLAIFPVSNYLLDLEYESTLENTHKTLNTHANSKYEILENSINTLFSYSDNIVNSDSLKLIFADVNNKNLTMFNAQKPYLKRTLLEFVEYNNFIGSASLKSGDMVINYGDTTLIEESTFSTDNKYNLSQIFLKDNSVFITIKANIYALDSNDDANSVATLSYSLNISNMVNKILNSTILQIPGSTVSIVSNSKDLSIKNNVYSLLNSSSIINESMYKKFNLNTDLAENNFVQVVSNYNHNYKVKYQYSINSALSKFNTFKTNVTIFSGLLAIIVAMFVLVFFWKNKNKQTRMLAKQYRDFAKQINEKQTMLESINQSIDEHLTVKDTKGRYTYINNAFKDFYNLDKETMVNISDNDLLYSNKLLTELDQAEKQVLKTQKAWKKDNITILSSKGTRYFDISKWPQKNGENITGIITISRDNTDKILHQQKIEKLQNQAVEALIKTVEIKDPHLAGHHERMAMISTSIAQTLQLDDEEVLTLKYASKLSGVGKVFVPKALLTKKDKLTNDEFDIIKTHIDSAMQVLKSIDFDLPICETINDMYERLDGSGYPKGIKSEKISQLSRILSVSDVFCALIVPRSYRDAKSFDEAINVIIDNESFDQSIVLILKQIMLNMPSVKKDALINLK